MLSRIFLHSNGQFSVPRFHLPYFSPCPLRNLKNVSDVATVFLLLLLTILLRVFRLVFKLVISNTFSMLTSAYTQPKFLFCLTSFRYPTLKFCEVAVLFYIKPTRCISFSNVFCFGITLYMFRTVFPSIIRSSRLYIQQQVYVNL